MKLCPSVLMRILVVCKSEGTTQKKICTALIGTLGTTDEVDYFDDAAISALSHGKKNFGAAETERATTCEKRQSAERFERDVVPLLDPNKLRLIVAAICGVIELDEAIEGATRIDLVGGLTKNDISEMSKFAFSDFVEGTFLYAVAYVANRDTVVHASGVTDEFLASFSERASLIEFGDFSAIPTRSSAVPLWHRGPSTISLAVGDLFSFNATRSHDKTIAVIPVDTSFATRLAGNVESDSPALVSPSSVHGQWLIRESEAGFGPEVLAKRISAYIAARHGTDSHDAPIGTVVPIDDGNVVYYLLAISKLDDGGNTQSSVADIKAATESLARFYGAEGQGFPLRVPPHGHRQVKGEARVPGVVRDGARSARRERGQHLRQRYHRGATRRNG